MKKINKQANMYVTSIIEDVQTRFVNEKTTIYSDDQIERTYEFEDGAVVRYEWQAAPGKNDDEQFNHRFTLVKVSKPNPGKLKKGVLRSIEFFAGGR